MENSLCRISLYEKCPESGWNITGIFLWASQSWIIVKHDHDLFVSCLCLNWVWASRFSGKSLADGDWGASSRGNKANQTVIGKGFFKNKHDFWIFPGGRNPRRKAGSDSRGVPLIVDYLTSNYPLMLLWNVTLGVPLLQVMRSEGKTRRLKTCLWWAAKPKAKIVWRGEPGGQ